ncbi:uncharacterized protein LOC131243681 isoform X2 [Magnolia sinica]|uniref:uncharacterized protein LOC131243681 isoform X2 n=1 Tax=Magnolia sinica TaxID=86752 RepID=UPI002657FEEE|nr:uncharacterized protein LOC131243681 isoform X2 [Magnolia sinica]XP_058099172.1 uncharacterized protein LOC131243681 isoform X2 [Magnolia sinica]XP_058099173.1 uncharacterized protein LOC131243681 isoform X2 [Magnolia sinica]
MGCKSGQESREEIHSSRVKYLLKRGKPYIWIQEDDLHNVNTILDERGSLSVTNIMPGPLMSLLRSIKKLPARVALVGDVVPLKDEKVKSAAEILRETILSERNAVSRASYSVSGILSSSSISCNSRSENLQEVLEESDTYGIYKFNIRSCTYIDGSGCTHDVDPGDFELSKSDLLSPFSEKLIDGINQSQARRRALMLFCFVYLNTNARDAFMVSVDRKGFDVLGKVSGQINKDGFSQYEWKEFRFTLKEEARDIEAFCRQLVEMEEEALKNVSSYSGLGLV